MRFCEETQPAPYPTTEDSLLLFIAYLHKAQLSHGTIKSYLAAIRYGQIARGLGNPGIHVMPSVKYVLKRAKKATPESTRRRLPITPAILRAIKTVWQHDPQPRNVTMLWAASCLCFFGFLRSGEIVCPTETSFDPQSHLEFADIAVDDRSAPSALRVQIKASKTDPLSFKGSLCTLAQLGVPSARWRHSSGIWWPEAAHQAPYSSGRTAGTSPETAL